MTKQLIISGFHRSGTSMLTQEFSNAGLFLGDRLVGPHISNADGHFEDFDFLTLHEKILKFNNVTWQFSEEKYLEVPVKYHNEMKRIIDMRNDKHKEWGVKDPRISLFLNQWTTQLDEPYIVVIYRHFEECVNSLLHRDSRQITYNDTSDISFWKDPTLAYRMWLTYNKKIIEYVKSHPDTTVVISHEAVMNGFPIVETVAEKFGFNLKVTKESTIKKSLLSPMKFQKYTLDKGLKDELEETWRILDSLSLVPTEIIKLNQIIPERNTLEQLYEECKRLDLPYKVENNTIDMILKTLLSDDIPLEEKIILIKKKRSVFRKFNANDLLIGTLETLIEKYPDETELYFLLSEIYIIEKKYDLSELMLLKVFSVTKKIFPYYYYRLANLYLSKNDLMMSKYYTKRAIEANPNNPSFYITSGRISYEECEYDKALLEYDKAIKINKETTNNPNLDLNFHLQKTTILHELDRIEEVNIIMDYLDKTYPKDERVEKKKKVMLQEVARMGSSAKIKELNSKLALIRDDPDYCGKLTSLLLQPNTTWGKEDLLSRVLYHCRELGD